MGWVKKNSWGKSVKGIVISKGFDTGFSDALLTSKDIKYIDLEEVLNEMGLKLK